MALNLMANMSYTAFFNKINRNSYYLIFIYITLSILPASVFKLAKSDFAARLDILRSVATFKLLFTKVLTHLYHLFLSILLLILIWVGFLRTLFAVVVGRVI